MINARCRTEGLGSSYMEQFTLKKNYLVLAIIFIGFISFGIYLLNNWANLAYRNKDSADVLLILSGIFFFSSVYLPYKVLRVPEISVANNTLQFGHSYYDLASAKELLLTAKRNAFAFNSSLSCIKITFQDGQVLTIDDWNYANINTFKVLLNSLNNQETTSNLTGKNFSINPPISYKGSFLWSYWGICFIIMQISMWVIWFSVPSNRSIFAFICIPLAIYAYVLLQVNYFVLGDNEFIIKNYLFPWKKKVHLLSEILEISVDSNFRMADSITIISDDYKSKKYYAGTIRDHEWRRLKVKLTELEIPVIDNQNI